jgi:hypothetical protein
VLNEAFHTVKFNVVFVSHGNSHELVGVFLLVGSSQFFIHSEGVFTSNLNGIDSFDTSFHGFLSVHSHLGSHAALVLHKLYNFLRSIFRENKLFSSVH